MTLRALVATLGGDLYSGGLRASVPAPGHSAADRSVSLMLTGDRLVIHCFGSVAWTAVRDHLRAQGLIDRDGRLLDAGPARFGPPADLRPNRSQRIATAQRLWADAGMIHPATASHSYLVGRAIRQDPAGILALKHLGSAPYAVYCSGGKVGPALVAAISTPDGALSAVEMTYLTPGGRREERLRTSRKMVGVVPSGSAVRLAPVASQLLVGEGVMSVLSASDHLSLPAWALLSTHNMAAWTPPSQTRRVVIAADRGAPGESAANRLFNRLAALGIEGTIAPPPGDAEDWNTFATGERRKEGG